MILGAMLMTVGLSGCAGVRPASAHDTRDREFFLISNGWHTALALPRRAIPSGTLRVADGFPTERFLVIGWGDLDFYANGGKSPWTIFHALFLPSPSALHVFPVHEPITARFSNAEILRFSASQKEFENLCRALDGEFARRKNRLVRLRDGHFPGSAFYLGSRSYSILETCNAWTARMLVAGGVRVRPETALVADDLMWQARKHAQRINAAHGQRIGF